MNINPAAGTHGLLQRPEDAEGAAARAGRRRPRSTSPSRSERCAREMFTAAEALDFERAARLRDELKRLEALAWKDGDRRSTRRRLQSVLGGHGRRGWRGWQEAEVALARREQLEQRREQGEGLYRRPRPLEALEERLPRDLPPFARIAQRARPPSTRYPTRIPGDPGHAGHDAPGVPLQNPVLTANRGGSR